MPWIAESDGQQVVPEEVEDGTDVFCPSCNNEMFPRGPFSDGRARHFAHKSSGGGGGSGEGCGGEGESATHRKWKSFTKSRLKQLFDSEFYQRIELEVSIPIFSNDEVSQKIANLRTGKSTREADVYVELAENHPRFGRGIAVEVQYRNESKDIEGTEADYLSQGISVLWLDEGDFLDDRCTLQRHKLLDQILPVFPTTVPRESEWEPVEHDLPLISARHSRTGRRRQQLKVTESELGLRLAQSRRPAVTFPFPTEWYESRAREFYRDTDWEEFFQATTHRESIAELDIDSDSTVSARVWLCKWLNDSEQVIVNSKTHKNLPSGCNLGVLDVEEARNVISPPNKFRTEYFESWTHGGDSTYADYLWLDWLLLPSKYELVDAAGTTDSRHSSADSQRTQDREWPGKVGQNRRSTQERTDRPRYEGWDESSASDGHVRRFDKRSYIWVELPIESFSNSARR